MTKTLLTALFLFGSFAFSVPNTDALWQKHCQEVTSDSAIFLKKLAKQENKLSFTNHGGLFNGGVCWWHSKLTRIFQYLAVFDPNAPALSEDEAYIQVYRLRSGKPTTFNGYRNLQEFSRAHEKAIQRNLEEWQISNGGFQLGFLDGLTGSSTVSVDEFRNLMDSTYKELNQNQKPIFQVLQWPGIDAHSWLVINMFPVNDGYQIEVVDSNYAFNQIWFYKNGDTHFSYGRNPFVNYTTRRGRVEEEAIQRRLTTACQNLKYSYKHNESIITLDQEVDWIVNQQTNSDF